MALTGMKSSNPRGYNTRSVPVTIAEINVTPLVDVMLVLLIVFMISAPLMQQGVQVDLPKANAGTMNEVSDKLVLTIKRTHQILLGEHSIQTGTLFDRLQAIAAAKPRLQIVIQADQQIEYGFVAKVMAEVKRAGIQRVGLVTEPGDLQSKI
jgi:biopolymer transport protein TolR